MSSKKRLLGATLFLAVCASTAHAEPTVVNPGFETGDFTGWTVTPAAHGSLVMVDSVEPHTGSFSALFGANADEVDTISQTLATTSGTTYAVSYYLANNLGDGTGDDVFYAEVDGTTLSGTELDDTGTFGYQEFTSTFVGTGSDTLSFAGYNGPNLFSLDDISVSLAAPELAPGSFVAPLVALAAGLLLFDRRRPSV